MIFDREVLVLLILHSYDDVSVLLLFRFAPRSSLMVDLGKNMGGGDCVVVVGCGMWAGGGLDLV